MARNIENPTLEIHRNFIHEAGTETRVETIQKVSEKLVSGQFT